MPHSSTLFRLFLTLLPLLLLQACRGDEILPDEPGVTPGASSGETYAAGMYVLNEGNYGMNRSSLDYLDLSAPDGKVYYFAASMRPAIRTRSKSSAMWATMCRS